MLCEAAQEQDPARPTSCRSDTETPRTQAGRKVVGKQKVQVPCLRVGSSPPPAPMFPTLHGFCAGRDEGQGQKRVSPHPSKATATDPGAAAHPHVSQLHSETVFWLGFPQCRGRERSRNKKRKGRKKRGAAMWKKREEREGSKTLTCMNTCRLCYSPHTYYIKITARVNSLVLGSKCPLVMDSFAI